MYILKYKHSMCLVVTLILICQFGLPQVPAINDPEVTMIDNGFQFVEGPVWKDGLGLLFSDIPANTIYLWTSESGTCVYLNPSGNSNGLAIGQDGLILITQHGPRQVSRLEANNSITPLATHYDGKRLNSPNDLVLHSDGSIFFTDPPYGLMDQGGTSELGYNGIFRLNPAGEVQLLDSTLSRPNGICFSPDETKLYVNDSESRRIYVWDVVDDTAITNKQEFAYMEPAGYADGMKVDDEGFLYVAGPIGIWIFDPDGTTIDTISVPGQTSNCGWGDEDGKSLYVTSGSAIYRISNGDDVPDALEQNNTGGVMHFGVNYPNPFSETVQIPFYLDEPCRVRIEIYNFLGEKVTTLLDQKLEDGNYTTKWDAGQSDNGLYMAIATTEKSEPSSYILYKR